MQNNMYGEILSRMGTVERPGGRVARNAMAAGIELEGFVNDKRADKNLSRDGRMNAVNDHVRQKAVPALQKATRQLGHLERQVETESKNMHRRVFNKAGEHDEEIRAVVRQMSQADATRAMHEHDDVARAVHGAPPFLTSNIAKADRDRHYAEFVAKFDPAGAESQRLAREGDRTR
jgi:hemerythrin